MRNTLLLCLLAGLTLSTTPMLASGEDNAAPGGNETTRPPQNNAGVQSGVKRPELPPSLIEENPYETYIQKMLEKGEYSLPSPDHGRITVLPEVTTVVPLSAVDQNRIVCPDLIRDARGSIEKGLLEPQIAGKEVFIKFAWVDTGRGPQYARQPNELFIMCGDERYQLLVRPRKIPTQTIYLSSGLKKRIEQNEGVFKSNSIEESAIKMIALVHNDDLPESFSIREVNRTLNKFKELKTRLKRKVIAEGTGMELYEYEVLLAEGIKEVRLDEDIAKKLAGEEGLLASSAARHQLTRECPECSGTRIFIVKSVFRGN